MPTIQFFILFTFSIIIVTNIKYCLQYFKINFIFFTICYFFVNLLIIVMSLSSIKTYSSILPYIIHPAFNTWIISTSIYNYHPEIINEHQLKKIKKVLSLIVILSFAVFVYASNMLK
jgi:hypothetical protein